MSISALDVQLFRLRLRLENERRRRDQQETMDAVVANAHWSEWLHQLFPTYTRHPFAERHVQFWEWAWSVQRGVRPLPYVGIWPRGGAKSTSAELACVAVGARKSRRYILYTCETQEQADKHVQTIAGMLERPTVAAAHPQLASRAVGKYGSSKGWRRNRVRTASGLTIDALGLDVAARGARVDEDRPDLIVLDDIDNRHDKPAATRKKIEMITQTLLLAGTSDLAVLGMQNLIHSDSVFSQLADNRATWLSDRIVSGPFPALLSMDYEFKEVDGRLQAYITKGIPTWEGQDIAACQDIIKTSGIEAFLRECQHEVSTPQGRIYQAFDKEKHTCPRFTIPDDWQRFMGLDFGGIHTAGVFLAEEPTTKRLFLYREYLKGDRTAAQHAYYLLEGEPMIPFCVGGSKSEGQWRKEFRTGGEVNGKRVALPVNEPDIKEVDVGIDRVRAVFKANGIIIFDDCVGVLEELRTYAWELDAEGNPTGEIKNKSAYHLLDGLRYILGRIRRGL